MPPAGAPGAARLRTEVIRSMPVPERYRVPLAVLGLAAVAATGIAVAVGPASLEAVAAPNALTDCATITEPGEYKLAGDIQNGGDDNFTYISGSCIRIESDNVTLRGNGKTVDGFGVSDTTAIVVGGNESVENVVVRNLKVEEWNRGVYVANGSNVTIANVAAGGNSFGVFAEDTRNLTVRRVTANSYFVGVYLQNSTATLVDNTLNGTHPDVVKRDSEVRRVNGTNATAS